jgi:hypothetical protein
VAKEVKTSGLLNAATDPAELTKKAWLDLDGVNDGWIESLNIEKVAGGGPPPRLTPEMLAAMFEGREACCSCCEAVGLTAAGGKGALICP